MPFEEGNLPVKYLGVPLISSRLLYKDCKILVEKVQNRIGDWKNKSLSFAGRLQLVISVLSSMHLYWASVFILPKRIIIDIEQLLRGFLWCQGDMKRGKAKVSWADLCIPKNEGGLGIRNLEEFNVALMTSHIWNIIENKESMWVRWIHSYKLKGRSIWDVVPRSNVSWGWRKILQIRELIRPYVYVKIGDGKSASIWFDKWCNNGPISNLISQRQILRAGYKLEDKVADVIRDTNWVWADLTEIHHIDAPLLLNTRKDKYIWKTENGKEVEFSVSSVWDSIRSRREEVPWFRIVWFSQCIPRHAFILWLIMRKKLKTQDIMKQWDVGPNTDMNTLRCPLCKTQPDSHNHLFFECPFSSQVWSSIASIGDMQINSSVWEDIICWIQPFAKRRTCKSVIIKLLLSAATYFIWSERNARLFNKGEKKPDQIRDQIVEIVRLKLCSLRFKNTPNVVRMLDRWKLPKNLILQRGSA